MLEQSHRSLTSPPLDDESTLIHLGNAVNQVGERMTRDAMSLSDRLAIVLNEPERGAATAEYAVVLVAATSFAAVLIAIVKSDTVRSWLSDLISNALNVV